MAGLRDDTLKKALDTRRVEMDRSFHRWKTAFIELRDAIQPTLGRFDGETETTRVSALKKIVDSKSRKALRTLSSGLMAGMTSPSRPWFRLGLPDKDLERSGMAKEWLYVAQSRMYDILRGSNAYRMLDSTYRHLGVFGTSAAVLVPDFENVIHAYFFPMGRYRIAEDEKGNIGYLHRDARMSIVNTVRRFGLDRVSDRVRRAYDRGDYHEMITVCHAIEIRPDRNPDSPLAKDKVMASIYREESEETFLEIGGFGTRNILAPRWEETEGEVWATNCPGMDALGDAVQLQGQHRDKALAIQKMHKPPLQGSQTAASFLRNVPGGVSVVDVNDLNKGGVRPIYEVRPDVQWLVQDINETRRRISEAFFEDLFLMTAMSDRRQVTATEIAERHEEKLLVLGPVLESLDHALLGPLIEATFHYMQEAELLPPPPREIANMPIKVEYISALAQAQRAVGVAPIERTIGFAATLEQFKPGTMDLIDADRALRDFAEQVGPPPDMIHVPDEVEKNRKVRLQQAQANQLLENAEPLANATRLVSEASERGVQGLQQGAPL